MLFTQGKPWINALSQSNAYFRYNSIQSPAVYGYKRNGDGFEFYVFKQRETYEAVSSFWGEKEPFLLK